MSAERLTEEALLWVAKVRATENAIKEDPLALAAFKKALLGELANDGLRLLDALRTAGALTDLSHRERAELSEARGNLCKLAVRGWRPSS